MNKLTIKVVTDAVMFVSLTTTLALGLLLKAMPTGGGSTVDKFFLGVHRHGWGELHFFMAVIFAISLGVHIWLNWAWVTSCAKRYAGENWLKALYVLAGAWLGVIIVGWIVMLIA